MSEGTYEYGYADLNHALLVDTVGSTLVQGWSAPDGGPLFTLYLAGTCACGGNKATKTLMLRAGDVADIIADLTRVHRDAGYTRDDLIRLVETRIGERRAVIADGQEGGHVIAICRHCGRTPDLCGCDWAVDPAGP